MQLRRVGNGKSSSYRKHNIHLWGASRHLENARVQVPEANLIKEDFEL